MTAVIFDTNVLLDFFHFHDPASRPLWETVLRKGLPVKTSQEALDEFQDVLSRPIFALSSDEQQRILQTYLSVAETVAPEKISPVRCKDPLDQKFLDLLVSEAPAILVSKDKLVLKCAKRLKKAGVVICTPQAALSWMDSSDSL